MQGQKNYYKILLVIAGICFFFSGFTSLLLEVVWLRRLTLVFGSTGFAVSTITAAFFGGLALGGYAAGRLSKRIKRPFFAYGVCELIVAGSA